MEASKWWNSSILILLGVILFNAMCSCEAYDFHVGGRDGWGLIPSETLNQWAERNRFQVNDRLVFKYNKEEDSVKSVLVVSKEQYDSCDTTNPLIKLDSGMSVFVLGRSGPFFFISGNHSHCEKGEKLVIVVMAARNNKNNAKHNPPPLSPPPSSRLSPSPSPMPGKVTSPSSTPASSKNSSSSSSSSLLGVSWFPLGLMVAVVMGAVFN